MLVSFFFFFFVNYYYLLVFSSGFLTRTSGENKEMCTILADNPTAEGCSVCEDEEQVKGPASTERCERARQR